DNGNPDQDTLGTNRPHDANFRQDFGLFRVMSLGNVVWLDRNNNGVREAGEPGIANATLNLRTAGGDLVATRTTNDQGGYLFSFLTPGSYRVEVVQSSLPAGLRSSTGTNASRVGPYEPATGATGDNTDHGTENGAVVQGAVLTLAYGAAPRGEE